MCRSRWPFLLKILLHCGQVAGLWIWILRWTWNMSLLISCYCVPARCACWECTSCWRCWHSEDRQFPPHCAASSCARSDQLLVGHIGDRANFGDQLHEPGKLSKYKKRKNIFINIQTNRHRASPWACGCWAWSCWRTAGRNLDTSWLGTECWRTASVCWTWATFLGWHHRLGLE